MARGDLGVIITRLAALVSKWTLECDRRLDRLYDYIDSHKDVYLESVLSVGDFEIVEIAAWPDADLAGDVMSSKSTSGRFIELVGADGRRFAIHWAAHKQGSTSHSTPEAETVSLADCLRIDGLAIQELFSLMLGRACKTN